MDDVDDVDVPGGDNVNLRVEREAEKKKPRGIRRLRKINRAKQERNQEKTTKNKRRKIKTWKQANKIKKMSNKKISKNQNIQRQCQFITECLEVGSSFNWDLKNAQLIFFRLPRRFFSGKGTMSRIF